MGEYSFNKVELTKRFSQDGLQYEVQLLSDGEFSFHLIGGASKRGTIWHPKFDRYNLWKDQLVIGDVDIVPNPLAVFRRAGEILLNWVFSRKPWYVYFSASTARKIGIYRWFSKRLEKRLPDEYHIVEYPEGCFNFYRQAGKKCQTV